MLNTNLIRTGVESARRLASQVISELDPKLWAHETSDSDVATEIADYVVGATQAVANNLQSVVVHFQNYTEVRYAQDGDMRLNMSVRGKPYPVVGDGPHAEREIRIDAYERALFVSMGSVLDTLAASVIGFSGLALDIHHADFGWFLPMTPDGYPTKDENSRLSKGLADEGTRAREEQMKVVRAFAAALASAGPSGWLDWTIAMRNMWVHREHRVEQIVLGRDAKKGLTIQRVSPADPEQSNIEAYRSSGAYFAGYYMSEDLQVTMRGLIESLNAAVTGTIEVLRHVWDERKANPNLIPQPSTQWRKRPGVVAFEGYAPGTAVIKSNVSMLMNPEDAERLRAAGLVTDRPAEIQ